MEDNVQLEVRVTDSESQTEAWMYPTIIGLVAGLLVVAASVGFVIWYFLRKKREDPMKGAESVHPMDLRSAQKDESSHCMLSEELKAIPGSTDHVGRIRGLSANAEKNRRSKNEFMNEKPK